MSSNNVKVVDAVRAGRNQYSRKNIAEETGMPWGTMYKTVEALLKADILFARSEKASIPVER